MKYQYTSKGYLNSLNSNEYSGIQLLLIGNIAIFILMEFLLISNNYIHDKLFYNLALVPNQVYNNFYIWQCITYLFLHGGIIHLLFNMLGLWFLGIDLEALWGKQKFLKYYFITGIGSALITIIYNVGLSNPFIPIVGASGAVYGLLLAYGIIFPNRIIYVYGIFPVKIRNAVIILGLVSFFYSITLQKSGISHITHLAGMLMGLIYLIYWKNQKKSMRIIYTNQQSQNTDQQITENHLNDILDKMNEIGWDALSDEDKEFLQNESKNYNYNEPPN